MGGLPAPELLGRSSRQTVAKLDQNITIEAQPDEIKQPSKRLLPTILDIVATEHLNLMATDAEYKPSSQLSIDL